MLWKEYIVREETLMFPLLHQVHIGYMEQAASCMLSSVFDVIPCWEKLATSFLWIGPLFLIKPHFILPSTPLAFQHTVSISYLYNLSH